MLPRLPAFVLLVLGLFVAAPAFANDAIKVHVQTIYATDGEPSVAAELQPLAKELESGFPGYTTFALVSASDLDVPRDQTRVLELPDQEKSTLELSYRGRTDDKKLLRLEVGLKGKIGAEVKATPGSTFFQAGLLYKDGILILAIRADAIP